jgi:hypothetical protein
MQLVRAPIPRAADRIVYPCAFDREAFLAICQELNFLSIAKRVDDFMAPFAPEKETA